MGIRERRDGEKAEMRKKIMDAAVEIINQDGYENLSIRKIAAKIEYSPTAIYLYYRDKGQIISDMADGLCRETQSSAAACLEADKSAPVTQQLRAVLADFIRCLTGKPEMAKAVIYSGMNVIFANDNKDSTPANEGINMLDQLLLKGIEEERFRPGIRGTGWMIVSALLGFVISAIENQLYLLEDFNRLADDFVELLTEGISR
ncbi:TetR/AcrR family transcriptional regulator [[Clostridium] symbiosum]|uniref:TetR/AcrR family transcriptional regulator n=1 Tax=Clostridium symbiosum TaxID=1512 RepID=UPI001D086C93|nr:TetR/AcrR family transcriptional regulator [[Clostridium] symbiosum]MCB6611581.1 TetR/AcrR family transcriptional regulator [[Clostridium] symbiosum]MCB6931647.1 TetR/AcrR family transcriptional regulator [[Clostridium] symbiosum]